MPPKTSRKVPKKPPGLNPRPPYYPQHDFLVMPTIDGISTANFQINGTFGTTNYLKVAPSKGFTDYSICARLFLIHYRGTYNAVLTYGNTYEIPDLIFIGKMEKTQFFIILQFCKYYSYELLDNEIFQC